jgi:hypothetical protein
MDRERAEKDVFERLKAELAQAFAAADSSYKPLTAAEVIARNKACSADRSNYLRPP